MDVFVNFSSHLSGKWDKKQVAAAEQYGTIIDVPFPNVPPDADEQQIIQMAHESVDRITNVDETVKAVMVQGEYTLTHAVVNKLISMGIKAVSACTERIVTERIDESGNTVKESRFLFVKFREYC